jgi:hypothetical protein
MSNFVPPCKSTATCGQTFTRNVSCYTVPQTEALQPGNNTGWMYYSTKTDMSVCPSNAPVLDLNANEVKRNPDGTIPLTAYCNCCECNPNPIYDDYCIPDSTGVTGTCRRDFYKACTVDYCPKPPCECDTSISENWCRPQSNSSTTGKGLCSMQPSVSCTIDYCPGVPPPACACSVYRGEYCIPSSTPGKGMCSKLPQNCNPTYCPGPPCECDASVGDYCIANTNSTTDGTCYFATETPCTVAYCHGPPII